MTTERPEISVIVPVHNGERFIGEALRSVETQGVRCRVIVVNDGSTDSTSEVLNRWPGPIEILDQDRRGPAAARNRALALADSPYIAFLDADDLWPEGKLISQLAVIRAMPEVDVVAGLTSWFAGDLGSAEVRPHLTLNLGSAVFRRSALDSLGGFDESIHGDCEDVDLFLRAREAGLSIHVLERVTLLYRRRAGSMTFGQRSGEGNLLRTLKRSLDRRRTAGRETLRRLSREGPLVSVIIPVFDGDKFVSDAIDSALSQSRPPFEIVVVDDGSRDRTPSVLERYAGRIRVFRQKRSGPSSARNKGIREARGDVMCFLDADDLLPPNSLAAGCEALVADDRPDAVLGLTEYRRMNGALLGEARFYNLGSALFRRSLFERIGAFDEKRISCEDVDLFLRAREAGLRIRAIDRPLLVRRKRPGSMSYGVPIEESGLLVELKRSLDRRRSHEGATELPSLTLGDEGSSVLSRDGVEARER